MLPLPLLRVHLPSARRTRFSLLDFDTRRQDGTIAIYIGVHIYSYNADHCLPRASGYRSYRYAKALYPWRRLKKALKPVIDVRLRRRQQKGWTGTCHGLK